MRIVYLGTGDFAVPPLRALLAAGMPVERAVSQPDRPAGRGRTIQPTPVHAAADELGLPHVQAEDINAWPPAEIVGTAELGVVAAFGQKLGPALLQAFSRGCVNIHGSLLPKYRGAAPYQWALLNGDDVTGVTAFQLDEKWDAGAILGKRALTIGAEETAEELHDRLAVLGAELIVAVVQGLAAGTLVGQPQDAAAATRAPKLRKQDGTVDWTQPAAAVVRRIHGLWPWPAVACTFHAQTGKSERVLLGRARLADANALPTDTTPPGTFHANRTVQTGCGTVILLEVKPAGGRLMPFDAFANGRQIKPGDRLEPVQFT